MPHENSLMYNVYIIPFWPMKAWWTLKKATKIVLLKDFPNIRDKKFAEDVSPDHPDFKIKRSYFKHSFHHH